MKIPRHSILFPRFCIPLIFVFVVTISAMADDSKAIRILSYNIHHGVGMDRRLDLERISEVIKSVSPDVVSLQEVDQGTGRSNGVEQAKELARLTGMNYVFGASMKYGGGKYGNAVLTKFDIEKSDVLPLPGEPRSALCVTLKVDGKTLESGRFIFVATHLDTKKEPRLKSVPLLEKYFANQTLPIILAGDLNATPESPTMQEFLKQWENVTDEKAFFTSPAERPSKQIDYVLSRNTQGWKCIERQVLDEAIASDHRPVFVVLEPFPSQ